MSKLRRLPKRSLEEVMDAFPAYRQSILAKTDNCSLSTRYDLEGSDYTNAAQARGIIFHRYAAEVLRTLRATGQVTIPHEEAMQILYEVSRQRDVPDEDVVVVPARERRMLRMCALSLADVPLDMTSLIDVETQLEAKLTYPNPAGGIIERTITGHPDALLADPPNGAIVLDWKTAPSAPAEGDQPHWTGDHLHVSYEGYFQQRLYALLVMRTYPAVQETTLREYYVLPREKREAKVPRAALEHIEQELALDCELLDRALMGGSKSKLWSPSPGVHCSYCSRPTSCPIEKEALLAEGAITSQGYAEKLAAMVSVVDQVRENAMPALKAWHERTGLPIPVKDSKGRHEWRWAKNKTGDGRRFKLCVPDTSDRGPDDADLTAAFLEAAERQVAAS